MLHQTKKSLQAEFMHIYERYQYTLMLHISQVFLKGVAIRPHSLFSVVLYPLKDSTPVRFPAGNTKSESCDFLVGCIYMDAI